jgi:hypothetical protein
MAIKLQNSVFVHIPKTGGRWVAQRLQAVKGYACIGDPVYDAHVAPDVDMPVFAFVRHPVTMLNSLWKHRSRKHANRRHKDWNWQQDHRLERECGCEDYFTFFENVAARPGIVTEYYSEFIGKYTHATAWKMENLAEELIAALIYYEESFDANLIRSKAHAKLGHANNDILIKNRPELIAQIVENEAKFCRHFNYTEELP